MRTKRGKVDNAQVILDYIASYQMENRRPPTIREMQAHCGFKSPRAVSYLLDKLENAKKIVRKAHSRGIQLADESGYQQHAPAWQLPFFASIPAGLGETTEGSKAHDKISFSPATLGVRRPEQAFVIKVRGASMRDAGILSGDFVVLEPREARPGDIVAALIDGESTLKRLVSENGACYLKAENPDYPDLVPLQDLSVQGVVVSVVRNVGATPA